MTVLAHEESEILVRLRLITKNARLVDTRRKEQGMTAPAMAAATGIYLTRLRDIENLRRAVPTEDEMCKIACILGKPIDYLFPEALVSAVRAGVFSRTKVELRAPEIISLTEAQHLRLTYDGETAMIEEISRSLLVKGVEEALTCLTPREERVLELRFGLKGEQSRTLKEVGKEFNVTGAYIREIEAKALRKLRYPSRSKRLKDYLD